MRLENYIYWMNAQRGPTTQLASEYKNRLLFSLLGSEGTNRFASNPFVCHLATTSFTDFSAEVKKFFQPSVKFCVPIVILLCIGKKKVKL